MVYLFILIKDKKFDRKSNSLTVTFIEHALYANIIFAAGPGECFYLPLNM